MVTEPSRTAPGDRAAWLAIGLTWLVVIGLVVAGARILREQVREQILGRDGEVLLAMARTQAGGDDPDALLAAEPFAIFVTMGRFEGIIAARMFDGQGVFQASVPDYVRESQVSAPDLELLRRGRPVSRFHAQLPVSEVFLSTNAAATASSVTLPAVKVLVPLGRSPSEGLAGIAEFIIEGSSVAREFARLDRRLFNAASVLLVVAMALTGPALYWAFRKLRQANRLLERRTDDLQRANRELAQSARVSALGAVTAHLVHGLRNPVTGLQSFVAAGSDAGGVDEGAWEEARVATERMQGLIQQVVRVLREHESDLAYEVGVGDVADVVIERAAPMAASRGVELKRDLDSSATVDNRSSGLLALLLSNLVENAIEAAPSGGCVRLSIANDPQGIVAEVSDDGPGVSVAAQSRLFQPKRSTKEGGSGLGLAITRQLALALGGSVTLGNTGPSGTTFRVELPLSSINASARRMEKDSSGVSPHA